MDENPRQHAGRYSSKKNADHYADFLKSQGNSVEVVPVTVYDIWITKVQNTMDADKKR